MAFCSLIWTSFTTCFTFGTAEATLSASARLDWRAQTSLPVTDDQTVLTLMKFLEVLEDNDDVQRVQANYDIPQDVMERLSA